MSEWSPPTHGMASSWSVNRCANLGLCRRRASSLATGPRDGLALCGGSVENGSGAGLPGRAADAAAEEGEGEGPGGGPRSHSSSELADRHCDAENEGTIAAGERGRRGDTAGLGSPPRVGSDRQRARDGWRRCRNEGSGALVDSATGNAGLGSGSRWKRRVDLGGEVKREAEEVAAVVDEDNWGSSTDNRGTPPQRGLLEGCQGPRQWLRPASSCEGCGAVRGVPMHGAVHGEGGRKADEGLAMLGRQIRATAARLARGRTRRRTSDPPPPQWPTYGDSPNPCSCPPSSLSNGRSPEDGGTRSVVRRRGVSAHYSSLPFLFYQNERSSPKSIFCEKTKIFGEKTLVTMDFGKNCAYSETRRQSISPTPQKYECLVQAAVQPHTTLFGVLAPRRQGICSHNPHRFWGVAKGVRRVGNIVAHQGPLVLGE